MPSNDMINYPFLCAAPAPHTPPSPEWHPIRGEGTRRGHPPDEQSLFPRVKTHQGNFSSLLRSLLTALVDFTEDSN